jgi:hypothetical protein
LALSEPVFTHAPPHSVPLVHAQMPPLQACPDGQACPHAPQLALLRARSKHAPEQKVSPGTHRDSTQAPATQSWSAVHARPQPPQWAVLVAVSTQAPPHSVPVAQPQVPAEHTWAPVQALPHAKHPDGDGPQARAPQSLATGGCVQAPAAQTSWVQAELSGVHPTLDATGTHATPFHCWHSGHGVQRPATQLPMAHVGPQAATHPLGDGPHSRLPQSLAIAGCVQTPPVQTSCVHWLESDGHEIPLLTGTQREPSKYWHAGHAMHWPSTHGPEVHGGPQAVTQFDGDGPQRRAPQSLARGSWTQTPPRHASAVQALASWVHSAPSDSGTQAEPFQPWQSGQRAHWPIWQ